ncbi:hypothetical protein OVN18_02790 [Microcella daejeonensis]|uniref:Uncharacterized protein n=1 Tax=Microcella daejeonensis TaxID=2994971 RepID=A0A9E8MN07_9MICO|nr:hypothetical protein [Microcella daejeonensis]WAB81962.1 hypothetical protein OVN18_02790 [Microcella daejeonensis]WAB84130.1 hypothetical protein OVN20_00675 [Microcella daejeonensis]
MSRTLATALPVWLAVVGGVIALLLLVEADERAGSLAVIAAGAVLLTFLIQVSLQTKEGLVRRMLVTVTGIILLMALASGLILILAGVG